jgi:hypothetical protein
MILRIIRYAVTPKHFTENVMPFPAPKINDCQGRSESASGSGLEIEEVVSRYIREADTDPDADLIALYKALGGGWQGLPDKRLEMKEKEGSGSFR